MKIMEEKFVRGIPGAHVDRLLQVDSFRDEVDFGRFKLVDGMENPHRLVGVNMPFSLEISRRCEDVRCAVAGGLNPQNMHDRRISSHPTDGFVGTYEARIGLKQGNLIGVVQNHANEFGRQLSVLDAGCGYGSALLELFEMDCIDRANSFGLTLRTELVKREVRDRVLGVNFAFLEVEDEQQKFDLFFSIFGALYYHPVVQKNGDSYLYNFPFLQALNVTKIGGLICVDTSTLYGVYVKDLVQLGIVELCTVNGYEAEGVLKLLRRPSDDEIASILKLRDGVMKFDV